MSKPMTLLNALTKISISAKAHDSADSSSAPAYSVRAAGRFRHRSGREGKGETEHRHHRSNRRLLGVPLMKVDRRLDADVRQAVAIDETECALVLHIPSDPFKPFPPSWLHHPLPIRVTDHGSAYL
jgi:hypothetical protein